MKSLQIFLLIPHFLYASSIKVEGIPSPLIVSTATAGEEPDGVTDSSSSYSLKITRRQNTTLVASLDSPMPPYTSLKMTLEAPSGSHSYPVTLSTTPQILIENIPEGTHPKKTITYQYSAKVTAGILPLQTKTIFLTLLSS